VHIPVKRSLEQSAFQNETFQFLLRHRGNAIPGSEVHGFHRQTQLKLPRTRQRMAPEITIFHKIHQRWPGLPRMEPIPRHAGAAARHVEDGEVKTCQIGLCAFMVIQHQQ